MVLYTVCTYVANKYLFQDGWELANTTRGNYQDPLLANVMFDKFAAELPTDAAITQMASAVRLYRGDELIREKLYDGEDVQGWHVAYHEPGLTPIEERYYIERVAFSVGYYAFMQRSKVYTDREVKGLAATLQELQQNLGDTFEMYDIM